jgi:hypothetical protein
VRPVRTRYPDQEVSAAGESRAQVLEVYETREVERTDLDTPSASPTAPSEPTAN